MARFITEVQTNKTDDENLFIAQDFLKKEGFELYERKGEVVWQKGNGLMTAPQFIKLSSQNGVVHLEAWLKYAWLPGVYSGEMGLTGFFGIAMKKMLQGRVDMLLALLCQGAPAPAVQAASAAGAAVPPASAQAVPVVVHNPTDKAMVSLVMGIIAVLGLLSPIVGVACGIIGIATGAVGIKSTAKGRAVAGIVLSIVFLTLSVINWVAGMIMFL